MKTLDEIDYNIVLDVLKKSRAHGIPAIASVNVEWFGYCVGESGRISIDIVLGTGSKYFRISSRVVNSKDAKASVRLFEGYAKSFGMFKAFEGADDLGSNQCVKFIYATEEAIKYFDIISFKNEASSSAYVGFNIPKANAFRDTLPDEMAKDPYEKDEDLMQIVCAKISVTKQMLNESAISFLKQHGSDDSLAAADRIAMSAMLL